MKVIELKVEDNSIKIEKKYITSGTYNYIKCRFSFSSEWENYDKIAVFYVEDKSYKKALVNDEVIVPKEVAEYVGKIYIGVYGNKIVNDALETRCTTDLDHFRIVQGAYDENAIEDDETIDISTYETYISTMNAILEEMKNNYNKFLEDKKGDSAYTIWLQQGNEGTEQEFLESLKGSDGKDGIDGQDGKNGQDGYTPVKGVDYFTSDDKNEFKEEIVRNIAPTLENNLKSAKDYTDNAIIRDFKDISYDSTTSTFVFTRHDNTTFTVDLPIEQTVKDGYYDEQTKELVLVLVSEQEIRIPASGLIDDYSGVDSATIQVNISSDNKITCNIKAGSITKTLLTTELQEEINNKVNKNAFVYDEETETLSITI